MRSTGLLLTSTILISLVIPGVVGAVLTADQFRGSNFNLYSSRCPANDMNLRDLKGRSISLSGLRGKVVILNFWRIDCPPCAMEKPILERIYRQYGPQGLAILSVNLFDNYNRIVSYVQNKGLTFTVAYDPEKHLSVRSQTLASGHSTNFILNPKSEAIYEIAGVPTTYVIDRNGMIVGHCSGMINWEQSPFSQLLESLLGPRPQIFAKRNQTGGSSVRQTQLARPTTGSGRTASGLDQTGTEPQPTRFTSNGKNWRRVAGSPNEGEVSSPGIAPRATLPNSSRVAIPANEPTPDNVSPSRKRQSKPLSEHQMPRVVINPGLTQSPSSSTRVPSVRGPTSRSTSTVAAAPSRNGPTQGGYRQPSSLPPATTWKNPQEPSTIVSQRTANTTNFRSMPRPATLPPAAPYSPSTFSATPYNQIRKKRGQPKQIVPASKDGYIVARVPGARAVSEGPATTARTISHSNAVGSFLLESFPGSPLPAQPTPVQYQPQRPGPSFFQRVGNWGSGIRNAFGSIIPAQ